MNLRKLPKVVLLPLLMLLSFSLFAQNRIITGRVTDPGGNGIPGVSVVVKGETRGTTTATDGTYVISVPQNADSLLFTSVGYNPQAVSARSSNANVVLQSAANNLNEVVVIGYGTRQKKDVTGSVSTVTSRDFQKGQFTSPEQLIAGKVAGVSIISNSGQPGAGSTIRIRGGASLNASNDPLIVVDGVPLSPDGVPGAGNALSFINPNDIESFTVLKDASAAAIYGTRASNGVIIITTKKGTGGKFHISFNTVNSLSTVTKYVDVLSADQFRAVVKANGTAAQIAALGNANTNWQKLIYQNALSTENTISFSGGVKGLPYRVSVGYQNLNGILKTDWLEKTSASINLSPTFFTEHLKVNLNLKGTMEKTRFGNQGAIGGATSFDPTQPVYSGNNRFGGYFEFLDSTSPTGLSNLAGRNPLGQLNQRYDESSPMRSIGNIQFDYKFHFLPDLHANLNLGYDISQGKGTIFVPDSAASAYVAGGKGGQNNKYQQNQTNTLVEFYLNYVKDIRSIRSRVDVVAGYSYYDYLTKIYNYASYYANGTMVPNTTPAFPFDKPEHTLISFFGRANYTFADRFILTGTLRRDGSSRFSPSNRWGLFPSGAFAWRMKDESFLKNSDLFSDLKLRLGYGVTGQQEGIGNYDYLSYYALSASNASYEFGNTFYQMYRPGGFYANRKWEQTATTNIGLDYGFLRNRITGSIDVYYRKTTNLLNQIPQPAGTNFSAYIVANVGSMTNKGIEFNINASPIKRSDFSWDVSFNFTYNKNNITNLTVIPNDTTYIGFPSGTIAGGIGGQFAFINAVGGPKNTFYLYQQVYDKSGAPVEGVFVDRNGDGIINEKDLYKGKSADPNVFMGFTTNVAIRKWSAGFVLRANVGNYVYNNVYSQTGTLSQITGNSVMYNASANYLTTQFKGGNGQELLSDYYLQNASFLRMDNFTIGYHVGRVFRNKADLQINGIIQNVFVITKYTGLDPEIPNGIDNSFYPRPRTYSLGLNLGF